ncbi:MAG: YHS domain-containing protein [Acidimicrobiia bacterium]|nr:YHS domain-containing protein [Acidimicrobiia bacterium]
MDLAGFTALTEVHGDTTAVDLIDTFVDTTRRAVAPTETSLVKTIGDAVMLAAADPATALAAVRVVFESCYDAELFLELRAGLHHGAVLVRDGDFFGGTVNLAARVAGRAGSGEALCTATVVAAARDLELDIVPLGAHHLRNVLDAVDLWAIELCPTRIDLTIDPVCRMRVSCRAAVGRLRHADVEHWFCSLDCAHQFTANPDRYLTESDS